jgi:hypothetical protein
MILSKKTLTSPSLGKKEGNEEVGRKKEEKKMKH